MAAMLAEVEAAVGETGLAKSDGVDVADEVAPNNGFWAAVVVAGVAVDAAGIVAPGKENTDFVVPSDGVVAAGLGANNDPVDPAPGVVAGAPNRGGVACDVGCVAPKRVGVACDIGCIVVAGLAPNADGVDADVEAAGKNGEDLGAELALGDVALAAGAPKLKTGF